MRQFIGLVLFFITISYAYAESSNFSYSGSLDGSYNYLARRNVFTSDVYNRLFDLDENGFTIQQLTLTLKNQPNHGFGGLITLVAGRDAFNLTPNGLNANAFHIQDFGLTTPDAYGSYQGDSFLLKFGEFRSIAGIESYSYVSNLNFSRSILNGYAQPGSHVGLIATKTFNDRWSFTIGSSNGWNTIEKPLQQDTIEAGISYTPNPNFSFFIDIYSGLMYGTDYDESGPQGWRNLFDFYGTLKITSALSLSLNYDYAFQTKAVLPDGDTGRATWQGLAGYISYVLTEKLQTNFRAEIFEDSNGYRTGVRQNWREVTLTLGYQPIKSLMIEIETRHDFSNVDAFVDKNGSGTNGNQQSYALNMYYTF